MSNKKSSAYMKVECIHGNEHNVVEFEPTGEVHGLTYTQTEKIPSYRTRYFVAGIFWGVAICMVAFVVRGV